MDASERKAIFDWGTVKELGLHDLQYQGNPVPGKMCEIKLTSQKIVCVWRSLDGQQYFCHGLTFGGKDAPGGSLSPYAGQPVETILHDYFKMIPEGECHAGDILVWRGVGPATTPHSAILTDVNVVEAKGYLDYKTQLRTKNGLLPERDATLEELIAIYGESYNAYRRR